MYVISLVLFSNYISNIITIIFMIIQIKYVFL